MKTKTKRTKKTFDAVGEMRQIRDKMSLEIADMSAEELKKYFNRTHRAKAKK